jgi:hypothetical protein
VPGPGQAPSTGEGVHLFAGLKGAVPILLASYLLAANIPQGARLYGIVVVVVVFSVLVQGSLVPTVARALRLPMRTVQPDPWALGIRLGTEPEGFPPLHYRARVTGRRPHRGGTCRPSRGRLGQLRRA